MVFVSSVPPAVCFFTCRSIVSTTSVLLPAEHEENILLFMVTKYVVLETTTWLLCFQLSASFCFPTV